MHVHVCAVQSIEDIIKTAVSFKRFHHLQSRRGSALCINHACQLSISPFPLIVRGRESRSAFFLLTSYTLSPSWYLLQRVFFSFECLMVPNESTCEREYIHKTYSPIMVTFTMHQISCRTVFALVHHAVCILLTQLASVVSPCLTGQADRGGSSHKEVCS